VRKLRNESFSKRVQAQGASVEREFTRGFAPCKDDSKVTKRKFCASVEREFTRGFAPCKDDSKIKKCIIKVKVYDF